MSAKSDRHGKAVLTMRRAGRVIALVLLLVAMLLQTRDAFAATIVSLDYPYGNGTHQTLTEADGQFNAYFLSGDNAVHISVVGDQTGGEFDFVAPFGVRLTAGSYENVGPYSYPFQSPATPSMRVSSNGFGCDDISGRFVVFEVVYGPNSKVERFAADLEQHCRGASAAVFGVIRFNSDVPIDFPVPTPAPPTPTPLRDPQFVTLKSQPGDYLGGGSQYMLSRDSGAFAVSHGLGAVSIVFNGGSDNYWNLEFVAPFGEELVPGYYQAGASPRQPAFAVSGVHRFCDYTTGRFAVLEAVYDHDGTVQRFAADFEQHCEGAAPALFGTIRFNSNLPADVATPTPVPPTPTATSYDQVIALTSDPGDYIGGGGRQMFTPVDGVFFATHDSGHVNITFYGAGIWTFDFAAPIGELLPGTYPRATRYGIGLSPTTAGLAVGGEERGCDHLTGEFRILDAVYGPNGDVGRFAATFTQYCESPDASGPALRGIIRVRFTPTPTPMPNPTQSRCYGDCNGDGRLTVDELVIGVNTALGSLPLSACSTFDCDGTGQVTVDCLLKAVDAALNGCAIQ